jgi:hypothetical protein
VIDGVVRYVGKGSDKARPLGKTGSFRGYGEATTCTCAKRLNAPTLSGDKIVRDGPK